MILILTPSTAEIVAKNPVLPYVGCYVVLKHGRSRPQQFVTCCHRPRHPQRADIVGGRSAGNRGGRVFAGSLYCDVWGFLSGCTYRKAVGFGSYLGVDPFDISDQRPAQRTVQKLPTVSLFFKRRNENLKDP